MRDGPLAWMFALQRFGVRPGLERVGALLADLGEPQEAFRAILVGGTNGKGTAAAALAAALGGGPGSVGLFTSPHLQRVTERFVVDGAELSEEAISAALDAVRPHAENRGATFFEVATAVAATAFAHADVRTAVFEVGLGGRWDATNVLDPALSIVTGVALDHVDILGTDLAGIARDKAGILRPGVPALTGAEGVAADAIAAHAEELGTPLWRLGTEILATGRSLGWDGQELHVATPAGEVGGRTALLGSHQRRNLALAVAAALRLGAATDAIRRALAVVRWPGRLEAFTRDGRRVVLDGAHNPAAAAALRAALGELGVADYALVVGIGADKDAAGILAPLAPDARTVVATRAQRSPRASDPAALAARLGTTGATAVADPREALAEALRRTPIGGTVLVAGSLYLVGEVRSFLTGEPPEPWERFQ